jgi:hypothetical protein
MGRTGRARGALGLAIGALGCAAFYDAATLHGRYELPAYGLSGMPLEELAFFAWYILWGGIAAVGFAVAAYQLVGQWLELRGKQLLDGRGRTVALLCFGVFTASLLFRTVVLDGQPITDDESAYELNARLLALGELTTVPPIDADFLRNQFVIVDQQRFHGKYPMGHSLVLLPFVVLGRVDLLGPLLAALAMGLSYVVAKRFVRENEAVLACALLAFSPHFVWTHGTLLSQTTSTACMLGAALFHLRFAETGRASDGLALGALLGFSVLVRPLPGALIVAVICSDGLLHTWRARSIRGVLRWTAWVGPGFLVFLFFLLYCNYVQSGSPLSSGYVEVHGSYGALKNESGQLTNAVGVALLRENAWLLGFPCSLLVLPFARLKSHGALFWSLISTTLMYRLLVPKTVVSTTGPIYLTEVVPWLCIATAVGLFEVRAFMRRIGIEHGGRIVTSSVAGAAAAAVVCFAPVALRAVYLAGNARSGLYDGLAAAGAERALVFSNVLVRPNDARTWAYYPPNPWPDLRDDVLFLRLPPGPGGPARAWSLWRMRFADRPAFTFDPQRKDKPLRRMADSAPP